MPLKFIYIFPHPDDESFGPTGAMAQQLRAGHEVHLLTLTRGEATSIRHELGVSLDEMADMRYNEMLAVKNTIGLTSMEVLNLPDGELAELDPRKIENIIYDRILKLDPHVVVTYPVHGVSGFFDHLVTHACVKRVFCSLCDAELYNLQRLAFLTLPDKGLPAFMSDGTIRMKNSSRELIDCVVTLSDEDIKIMEECLNCYKTYQGKIEESKVMKKIGRRLYFEFYQEDYFEPVDNLEYGLSEI